MLQKALERHKKGVKIKEVVVSNKNTGGSQQDGPNIKLSKEELKTVKQAIADLTLGKFLDNTKGSMENSRTFGYLPFDITLKDVMQQARYLSETKGMKWGISEGKKSSDKDLSAKETELF